MELGTHNNINLLHPLRTQLSPRTGANVMPLIHDDRLRTMMGLKPTSPCKDGN
jgi:hypothetical protein